MKHLRIAFAVIGVVLALALIGCSSDSESGEHSGGSESRAGAEGSGEHGGNSESGEHSEESGTQFARDEAYDEVRAGARLILSYDSGRQCLHGHGGEHHGGHTQSGQGRGPSLERDRAGPDNPG